MIFRRSYNYTTKHSRQELRQQLEGKHIDIHGLDFEVMDKSGTLKIIPHTEYEEDKVYTLPITHLICSDRSDGGVDLKVKFKPRRIDIGGPYIGLTFVLFIIALGVGLYIHDKANYELESLVMVGLGSALLIGFFYRMNQGYYDYIRKIKKWVKSKL